MRAQPIPASMPTVHWQIGSIEELIQAATAPCVLPENEKYRPCFLEMNGGHNAQTFFGVDRPGHAALVELIRSGWPTGMDKARAVLGQIELPAMESVRRVRVRGDQGDELDMDAVRAGALDRAWTRTRRFNSKQPPNVHVIIDATVGGSATSDSLFWRGAAGAALVCALSNAGYSVRCTMAEVNLEPGGKRASVLQLTLKDYIAPLDETALFTAAALPAVTRSLMYATIVARCPTLNGGVGSAAALPPMVSAANEVTLIASQEIKTAEHVRQWIADAVVELETPRE